MKTKFITIKIIIIITILLSISNCSISKQHNINTLPNNKKKQKTKHNYLNTDELKDEQLLDYNYELLNN